MENTTGHNMDAPQGNSHDKNNNQGQSNATGAFVHDSKMTRKLAGDHRYYIFLVTYLVLMSALGSFVNDMYTPSLPAMCRFFGASVSIVQMGLTCGMIGLALGQLILGPLSDRYGRKPVLVGSVALFIVAAVASIFSPTIHVFNICRIFQGIGASGGYFLARTIPADVYRGRSLAKLMALIGGINGIAPASAPVLGGVTADHWGWKGVFIVLAVFAALILLSSVMMKETLPPSARTAGHWWHGMKGYAVLLHNRKFMTHVAFKGLALGMLFAYVSAAPFIVQREYGLSQTAYGLVVGFNALFAAAGSMMALKFRPLKRAADVGAGILLAASVGQGVSLWLVHSLVAFEVFMVLMIFGLGLIFSTTNTLAMNEGRDRAGDASAMLGVSGYIVGAVASPLVGLGNIMHSTAITFVVLALLISVAAYASSRIAPDLDS